MSKPPLPISVSIIAKNEEARIGRCLNSVASWAQEIVVIINDTDDKTAEICNSFGAKVVEKPWMGFGPQKNFALNATSQNWVLCLDADEVVSFELKQAIHDFFYGESHHHHKVLSFPRRVHFMGRWILHGDWYPDYNTRLFHREHAQWSEDSVHENVITNEPVHQLKGDLLHFSNPSVLDHVEKMIPFTELFLLQSKDKGKRWSLLHNLFRPWWRFNRSYFLKQGFRDGFPGLYIAIATYFSTFLRYTRLYEDRQTSLPSASVIVSTYKSAKTLNVVLNGLLKQNHPPLEIIVAEDAEEDDTKKVVGSHQGETSIIHVHQPDDGFRKSIILNKAISKANGELIIFLDGDCIPHPDFVGDHIKTSKDGYFIQGRRAFIKESSVPDVCDYGFDFWKLLFQRKIERPLKSLRSPFPIIKEDESHKGSLGCNLAIMRSDLLSVRGFDESYEGWGREDSDLAVRLINAGKKRILLHGQAIVYHLNHPVQSRQQLPENDQRLQNALDSGRIQSISSTL